MERAPVESSMIASVGYEAMDAILEIEFKKNGQVWQYFDIPEYLYGQMLSGDSIGKFFLREIRGKYREARV